MSVTAPGGFRAAGVTAGLKASGKPDLALVVNDGAATAAAVFTTNRVVAAPVVLSRRVVAGGTVKAVVLNSGGANACTGAPGDADAEATAAAAAAQLGCAAGEVAVASTGLIGVRLPMDLLLAGVAAAASRLGPDDGPAAAEAICTTDTVAKQAVVTTADGVTVGGMAKGAGMLAPALATMLVVLTTDAAVAAPDLDAALRPAVAQTFDRVDSDGCMSTNDMVLLMASGASGAALSPGAPGWAAFVAALGEVCADLARQLVADAEGATKLISVEVVGAADDADALEVARAVARSNLLKCAIHGADPNWGRVLAAVGTTNAAFDPDRIDVSFNGVRVCRAGVAAGELDEARVALKVRDVTVTVDLHAGPAAGTILTTDLTAGYVHENSAYST
ncbi:MAG TPA: bifunctional glutamate N-acetyltransferase/amino-acid acetyltransferase ArgJ [Mycobacteriales bacterium]|jgi:glutamate N-acetyltransferase/amino-acid N-acetyltransferase|nr:bifunctional glutamate N-acetyltransferase/amino-acid acetyltransferase ArgJ [Mycobacteriales bacterium]